MKLTRWILILIPGLWLLTGATGAQAQTLPLPGAAASPSSTATAPALLTAADHAPVLLSNRYLFRIYSSGNRNAQDRADLANLRLEDVLRGGYVGASPHVTVDTSGPEPVLRIGKEALLSVTRADADANGNPPLTTLANSWADSVNTAFRETQREQQPAYLRWATKRAGIYLLVGVCIEILLWLITRHFGSSPGGPAQLLLWLMVALSVCYLFPESRPLNVALFVSPFLHPLTVFLFVGLMAATLARLWSGVLRRLFPPLPDTLSSGERTERTFRRRATLGGVARVTGVALIWTLALLVALTRSGVNLAALLASASLIGFAVSLVFQDSAKDLVAGINILVDDRFGVGDTVQVGLYTGSVEQINLRITQIRDTAGRLITIPNRNIAEVANLTSRWAQVDFQIGVSYYDDIDQAIQTLETTAQELAKDWPEMIQEPPKMLGVEAFNDVNITLRMTLRTPPGDQWTVAREMRRRAKRAFDAAGIGIVNAQHIEPVPHPARIIGAAVEAPPDLGRDGQEKLPERAAPTAAQEQLPLP